MPQLRASRNLLAQYFTPEPVARFMTHLLGLEEGKVIDPACGDGVFLRVFANEKPGAQLHGCDLDSGCLEALTRALHWKRLHLTHADALAALDRLWGTFDGAIGNPPFSAQSELVKDPAILRRFDLGRGRKSQAREVLFLELFLRLLRVGGRFSIILPEGVAAARPLKQVREWLLMNAAVESIVSLPRRVFAGTAAKCVIVTGSRIPIALSRKPRVTKLAVCKDISDHLWSLLPSLLSERRPSEQIVRVNLQGLTDWRPEYVGAVSLSREVDGERLVPLGHLAEKVSTGFAVYGSKREILKAPAAGRVRLIAAKNFRPTGGLDLSREVRYIRRSGAGFASRALLREGDLLFVRVGVGCCGRVAVVHPDGPCQADDWLHIVRFRPGVDPHYVAAWLMCEPGRRIVKGMQHGVGTVSISRAGLAAVPVPRLAKDREDKIARLFQSTQQAEKPEQFWRQINRLFAQESTTSTTSPQSVGC